MSAFSFIFCRFNIQLRLPAPAFTSLIFICLLLLDISDVYSLDFFRKTIKLELSNLLPFSIFPH